MNYVSAAPGYFMSHHRMRLRSEEDLQLRCVVGVDFPQPDLLRDLGIRYRALSVLAIASSTTRPFHVSYPL